MFNKGLAFDDIKGDFVVIDGNAYTDNLKLTGPAAEIGIIGRTGLRDHDYRQQAVVTSEPGNLLPTVGLLGGPGGRGGAADLHAGLQGAAEGALAASRIA